MGYFKPRPDTPRYFGHTAEECRARIAAAELIGWPELAESWRETLAEIEKGAECSSST